MQPQKSITRYADLAATKLVATSDYTFDAAGRLTALSHAQGATPLAGYSWTYDAGNRVTEFTSLLDGTADYTYDQTDQLVDADYTAGAGLPTAPPDEAYGYDANGNRTMSGFVTGDNNLVLSDGTYDYQYDAEGNRTRRTHIASGEVTDYHWDHRNRLTRVSIRTTANGLLTTDILYAYDAFNRLVRVTLHTTDNGPLTTDTFHVYDGERWERGNAGDHLALVFDGNGDLTNRYLYGPAVDQILADEQLDSLTTPGDVLWPLTENFGTVRDLAAYDDATGDTTVVNHRTYTAFGQILSETDPTIQHRFAYTGRQWDKHAGLYHYRARWYDPALGRFLSQDPIGISAGDPNFYRYAGNGPTNATDPSGLQPPWLPGSFPSQPIEVPPTRPIPGQPAGVPHVRKGEWALHEYFARVRDISHTDASYGCGGMMMVLTGLPRVGLLFYYQSFTNPLDASRELLSIQATGRKAMIIAVGSQNDAPSNFATLLGTPYHWYWVFPNHGWGSDFRELDALDDPPVILHDPCLPPWKTKYYVVPDTTYNSPGFGDGPWDTEDPIRQLPGFPRDLGGS